METEAKAMVAVSVWGAKFVQFLAALSALAVLPPSISKKGMNSTGSFKSTETKQETWQGI